VHDVLVGPSCPVAVGGTLSVAHDRPCRGRSV